jgi:hypothetical protein
MYKNSTDLAQNDTTAYVIELPKAGQKSCIVNFQSDSDNHASATVRVDSSTDHGETWTNSIALSDPTAAIGAAYLTALATGQTGTSQDRLFGATHFRIVRTDGNGGACKIASSVVLN